MGSQYAYGECAQQRNGQMTPQMSYYTAPRLFNTVAEHIKSGQAVEHIPYRLFVGGFGAQVTETALREHFEQFFTIRDVKVIRSPEGISKGYGFVTFDTEDEAKAVQAMDPEDLKLNGKPINLGPALRKMVHSRYSSEYPMAVPTGQYSMQSPTMQYAYNYPTPPQNGSSYMMGYAPQGMVPLNHSMSGGEDSSQSLETSGGEEQQMQQMQHSQQQLQQPPALSLQQGVQNCSQPTFYHYVPPPTPMTPTFRAFPCAPLYGPPPTPQMFVDGSALYPQMMSPMMYHPHPQYFPPTPSMDTSSYSPTGCNLSPAAGNYSPPQPLLSQLLPQHYPPLERREKSEKEKKDDREVQQTVVAAQPMQAETAMGDIRLSYATIAAKLKSPETTTVAKEVEQISTQMGSMKMNGAGGDYAATAKNAVAPSRV